MKFGIVSISALTALTLAGQAGSAAEPGGCAEARKALPAVAFCAESTYGVALADSAADAASLAELGRRAEARFETYFGRKPSPYALLSSDAEADLGALKAIGYKISSRWQTDAQYDQSILASLKSGIDKMVSERGLSKEQADQMYNEALDRHSQRLESGERNKTKGGIVPHQLGHGWFSQAFWPAAEAGEAPHAGGPAPDWIDEVAALLMEDDAMSAQRRDQFKGIYTGKGSDPMSFLLSSEQMVNLGDLLTQPFPVNSLPGGSGMVMVARGGPGGSTPPMVAAPAFSLRARMFADYLIERTGQARVFATIAAAIGQNKSLEQWLSSEGTALGLPGNVAGLEADWKAWLQKKFGKPG